MTTTTPCARAAPPLAIRRAIEADNATRHAAGQEPVSVRIGLHSGPAIVGNIGAPGRINYTLVGDTVNVTQRIEQLIKRLDVSDNEVQIAISADVVDALDGMSDVDGHRLVPCGAHALPGRDGVLEVYVLE